MNRRTLLRAGVGLTAALASGTNKANTPATDCSCDVPSVEAGLYCEKDACIAAARDFGNIISVMPHMHKLGTHMQRSHISSCKRFAAFLKRSPDTATAEDIRRSSCTFRRRV